MSNSPEKLASVRLRLMLRSLISDAKAMTTFQDRDLGADGPVGRGTEQMVAVTEAKVMRQFVHVHSLLTQIRTWAWVDIPFLVKKNLRKNYLKVSNSQHECILDI